MSESQAFASDRRLVLCAIAFSSIVSCILTLSAVLLIPNGFGFAQGVKMFNTNAHEHLAVGLGEDVNRIVPSFASRTQVSQNNSDYGGFADIHSMSSEDVEAILSKWDTLLPIGDGFVPVQDPPKYKGLPPPLIYNKWSNSTQSYEPTSWYSTAVFHQIHCLKGMLEEYLSHHGVLSPDHVHTRRSAGLLSRSGHMLHCFDYLREAIMCLGDTALEGSDPERGTQDLVAGTFGTGTRHVCKDWSKVVEYAESVGNPEWGQKKSKGGLQHGA
ncbi:Putative mycotoxin biosynthesis protein UstYa [Septoria linicola]|uniref:Mycotoxin biosynthesis protein UstYa n=1 Tax=Septoria linicola TaxID=215465 RepID=A0A9Q9EK87_9PEZI|nr:putative mycotoxin biosynthesis protein UstYa [Septoria linicola]USW52143.1 Putative mycotoxin biosynthesis protein UstYa [Septoria linicola]